MKKHTAIMIQIKHSAGDKHMESHLFLILSPSFFCEAVEVASSAQLKCGKLKGKQILPSPLPCIYTVILCITMTI